MSTPTKSLVKWVASNYMETTREDCGEYPGYVDAIPIIPLADLTEVVEGAIDAEEEMPGEIPQEMYDTITNGDKDTVAEALRIVVRVTKKSIKQRLLAQLEVIPKQNSGSNT